jgi:hypothetical protein
MCVLLAWVWYCPGVHDSAVVQQRVNQGNMKGRARVVGCCCWQCIGAENAVYWVAAVVVTGANRVRKANSRVVLIRW